MTIARGRMIDEERDEASSANRGGVAFLLVHGVTWTAAAILTFVLQVKRTVVSLFVLIAITQGLSLPGSIIVWNLDLLYLPVTFAATNGGQFLPYTWLHRTRAYAVLAVACALGPFAIMVVAGAGAAFHAIGFLVGTVMLAVAAWISTRRTTIETR